jgi:hypothetical protein
MPMLPSAEVVASKIAASITCKSAAYMTAE